jgi:hypothetical protein
MNWERVNAWTTTFYTLLHSLSLAKAIHFGDKARLADSVVDSRSWISTPCSFASVLVNNPIGDSGVTFRRDPSTHFESTCENLIRMLIQDLVVIFDQMMDESLAAWGETAGDYPQSKVEKLATHTDAKYEWAVRGCLEMIAARNVLAHSGGCWNTRSVAIVSGFVNPPPKVGDKLEIGFQMLFRYRKAIRTLLNQSARP